MLNECYIGDCRIGLQQFIDAGQHVQMCVTSPPYWGLRDYGIESGVWGGLPDCEHVWGDQITINKGGPCGTSSGLTNRGANQARTAVKDIRAGQFCQCGAWLGTLGLEPDHRMYVEHIVEVMELVRKVLADDGTLWLNLGDSYSSGGRNTRDPGQSKLHPAFSGDHSAVTQWRPNPAGVKPKDLMLIPARVAIALQEAGWWVRQDIIWSKPNPMPESVTDRCTKAHEYLFLLSKSPRYYYDFDAMQEPVSGTANARGDSINPKSKAWKSPDGWDTSKGEGGHGSIHRKGREKGKVRPRQNESFSAATAGLVEKRNKRSVWTVQAEAFPDAHFATFPRKLIEPCILAGSRKGDVVLDPFMGSGTTAQVAQHLGRQWLGCELNPEYLTMQHARLRQQSLDL